MNRHVKTTPSKSNLIVIFCFISVLLSSCASLLPPRVNQKQAIKIGIDRCKSSDMELISEPENIRTKLVALKEASRLIDGGDTNSYAQSLDTRVWLVQMDGQLQLVGGPAIWVNKNGQETRPTPQPPFWGTCSVILDANSGEFIELSDR